MGVDTKELEQLMGQATDRPWLKDDLPCVYADDTLGTAICFKPSMRPVEQSKIDFALIAAAVNALPDLLKEREKLLAACHRAEIMLNAISLIISISPECAGGAWQGTKRDIDAEVAALRGERAS